MLVLMDLRLFPILPKERTKRCFHKLFQMINQRHKPDHRWKSPPWPLCYLKPRSDMQRFSEGSGSLPWSWSTRGLLKNGYFPFIFKQIIKHWYWQEPQIPQQLPCVWEWDTRQIDIWLLTGTSATNLYIVPDLLLPTVDQGVTKFPFVWTRNRLIWS